MFTPSEKSDIDYYSHWASESYENMCKIINGFRTNDDSYSDLSRKLHCELAHYDYAADKIRGICADEIHRRAKKELKQ